MVTPRSASAAILLLLLGCSSTAFEVGQGDGGDETAAGDSAADTGTKPDSSIADSGEVDAGSDTSPKTDTGTAPDTAIADTGAIPDTKIDAVVDVGCVLGTTKPCECGGVRSCGMDGTFGMCHDTCLPSPFRFICAYGKGTCTSDTCFDSNNCSAKCGCASAPGSTCALTDPCWSFVCNGYVCPS